MARGGRIPILDMAKYHRHRAALVEELRTACHTGGFFLVRHDLSTGAGDRRVLLENSGPACFAGRRCSLTTVDL